MPGYEEFNPYPYMPDEEENMQPYEERHGKHDKHHKKDKHKKHHKKHENGAWDEHRGGKHKKKHHNVAFAGCFLFGLFFILLGALLTKCIGKCCKNKRKRCKEYKRRMVYFILIVVEIKTNRRRNLKTRKSSFRPQE